MLLYCDSLESIKHIYKCIYEGNKHFLKCGSSITYGSDSLLCDSVQQSGLLGSAVVKLDWKHRKMVKIETKFQAGARTGRTGRWRLYRYSIGEAETLINHYDINKDITDSDRSSSLLDTITQWSKSQWVIAHYHARHFHALSARAQIVSLWVLWPCQA